MESAVYKEKSVKQSEMNWISMPSTEAACKKWLKISSHSEIASPPLQLIDTEASNL